MVKLFSSGHEISVVLAADAIELKIPPSSVRTKARTFGLSHPRDLAASMGVEYVVVEHNGPECIEALQGSNSEAAVIAGARILKGDILNIVPRGIVNFHPGKIPEARGLEPCCGQF